MIKIKKINDKKVTPLVKKSGYNKDNVVGYDLIKEPYANIFIASKKKSGKTSVIAKLLDECANKHTHILLFSSTIHKDDTYEKIMNKLDKKGISYETHLSIYEDGNNVLKEWEDEQELLRQQEEVKKNNKKNKKEEIKFIQFDESDDESDDDNEKKSKKIAPKFIFVFDDLSMEMNNKHLSYLLSRNRHFQSKIIISTQYYLHLSKEGRTQIDYIFIFKNMPEEKLIKLYQEADLNIPEDLFFKLYHDATKEPYCFFYINTREMEYRKCFQYKYDF